MEKFLMFSCFLLIDYSCSLYTMITVGKIKKISPTLTFELYHKLNKPVFESRILVCHPLHPEGIHLPGDALLGTFEPF